jgi:hypothetical protein
MTGFDCGFVHQGADEECAVHRYLAAKQHGEYQKLDSYQLALMPCSLNLLLDWSESTR